MARGTIGIVGQGFVGVAVREGMLHAFDVAAYDKKDNDVLLWQQKQYWKHGLCDLSCGVDPISCEGSASVERMKTLVSLCSTGIIFVCLPTPMKPDGSCDISIVDAVVCQLDAAVELVTGGNGQKRFTVVIKSTVPPGTTERLNQWCHNIDVCFQPEFLTEASACWDFKNQNRIICGGVPEAVERVRAIYATAYRMVPFRAMTSTAAELVKYFTNVALACRVSLANEFRQIAQALAEDYDAIIDAVKLDTRIGSSHWSVPGPDNHLGFGGSCFVKDLNALMYEAKELGIDPCVMEAVWKKNVEVRPERDWEQLVGRAVVCRVDSAAASESV